MLKERPVDISEVEVAEADLGTYEPSNPSLVPLLYQTGYLTIKKFGQVGESAQLKPRNGVRHRLAEKRRLTIGDGQENASCAGRLTTTLLPILKRVEGLTPMVVWEWWSSCGICYNARHESFAQFQA